MGILMSAYVGETDSEAQDEAKEGVWYFLKNCLKGHLRREGRSSPRGRAFPTSRPYEFRSYLKFSDPTAPLLGDAEDWERPAAVPQSIIVGGADTVYRRIMDIVEHTKVGHLLIQFHLGNMPDALARKSMHCSPRRWRRACAEASAKLFGAHFPEMERSAGDGTVTDTMVEVRGRKVGVHRRRARRAAGLSRTASPTCTGWPANSSRFTCGSARRPG